MTLYEKVGRKYKPVQDTKACDGLTNGSWLITVQGGLHKCPTGKAVNAKSLSCAEEMQE